MMTNQLPEGVPIRFTQGPVRGKGFGLGGAVTLAPSSIDPPGSEGEFQRALRAPTGGSRHVTA
jgi:hypothetical protein